MAMKLSFSSIQNENIFQPEFKDLNANGNNVIEFRKQPQELQVYCCCLCTQWYW